jgi:hypothetical protein
MLDEEEIGRVRICGIDEGMGIATGEFQPSKGYAHVRPLFRSLSDAGQARDVPEKLWKERDALKLRVLNLDGAMLSVDSVMVYDFDIKGEYLVDMRILKLDEWERLSIGELR